MEIIIKKENKITIIRGNIEYVEYRFVPLPFLSSLSGRRGGRESLRGSSSILAPTLEESKRRSIRPELLLLLPSLDGARRWKFRDVCMAEMRGRISRVTRTILFRLPHRLRINQPIFDIYFLRAVRRLFGRLPDIETLIDIYICSNPILHPFLKNLLYPLSFAPFREIQIKVFEVLGGNSRSISI